MNRPNQKLVPSNRDKQHLNGQSELDPTSKQEESSCERLKPVISHRSKQKTQEEAS